MRHILVALTLLLLSPVLLFASVTGKVTDFKTGEPLIGVAVYYEGTGIGVVTDTEGVYTISQEPGQSTLTFSYMGYQTQSVRITDKTTTLNIQLKSLDYQLDEVVVRAHRDRYSRRNNPAIEFMEKVIAHKSERRLEDNDFYQYKRYQRMKTSLYDISLAMLEKGVYKKFPFLTEQVELSQDSSALILPLSMQETASEVIYRKSPESKKTIVRGVNSSGIEDLFSTSDMVGKYIDEVFAGINIYDNNIRLLDNRFVSPISSNGAISFYRYYLMDTVAIDGRDCVDVFFTPENPMDFGFTGHLYVLHDSTYTVRRCEMKLPYRSGVNFVNDLNILQDFTQLEDGQWVLRDDRMTARLTVVDFVQSFEVDRSTHYSDYRLEAAEHRLFTISGNRIHDDVMHQQSLAFWEDVRPTPLSSQENALDQLAKRILEVPGVRPIVYAIRILVENYVETATKNHPSYFDFGPVNTFISWNHLDGFRLRVGGHTTVPLSDRWFLSGYGAYGFKDQRWKYEANLTYAFRKRQLYPWEFPLHNLTATYRYDVASPMDKFLGTDKDNIFVAWKSGDDNQMSYIREASLKYQLETNAGFSFTATVKNRNDQPAGGLQYIRNDEPRTPVHDITTTEANVLLRYAPGESFVNTKTRRMPISLDAPIYTLSHTTGVKGLFGGDYDFNYTELGIRKRFWFSGWGKIDIALEAGAQWNKVPFPLLIFPAANLSYTLQPQTFSLINSMEFINDRFASLMVSYDLNGKLFNRIPLLRELKWREMIQIRTLFGDLTDKNNPMLSQDANLFRFPEANGQPTSFVMDPGRPYVEASFGIYNIFKVLHVEYVRRLTYLSNPNIHKDGVRFMIKVVF